MLGRARSWEQSRTTAGQMRAPQNHHSPPHEEIPRERLVCMKEHQANIKPASLVVNCDRHAFSFSRTSCSLVTRVRNRRWHCTTRTKLVQQKCSTAATATGWGQREHLPALPALHPSWTQPGNHSSTVSGSSSSCLGASHHTAWQQPEGSAPLPALGIHTTEGSWDLKEFGSTNNTFRISFWDLCPPNMNKLSSCWQ